MAAQQRKTGLGRGLGALLNDSADIPERNSEVETSRVESATKSKESGNISTVNVDTIEMNPFQPRTDFDPQALQELSESILLQGLIQPITVRKIGENAYQLISGERRYRASKLAGITEIPAYIRTANDQQMLEMALIENIQRENLNAIEVALSFQRMIEECNLKQEELGERVSKNRSTVTNYLRLLKLPPVIQAAIRDGELTMGHARALINVGEVDKQLYIFKLIVDLGLSVRKAEELVREIQNGNKKKAQKDKNVPKSFQFQKIEDDLASKFSSQVKLNLKSAKGKGAIEIPFESEDDLSRILELLDW
ncbi:MULTISPECIES: ParB/RepB/Spo0J family partition protein [Sphingobacterium]|jgi:ParB family chromosome partitioning protein|uniref:ParB/RepB/Spo0J family partition protein n=1 Tax=Sphingobacterium kitahiroshimense TaxID=470446 RepID=A0ABV0BQJ6_9SPHI|nr:MULTISPECIES: ParB/RepB/Spo0J family partition protein [Sphingobacterium]KKX49012.1 chromosome partitioning protein ParB [Sphingobacterium sp. IITKGP-BTPF85]MBB2954000.1 ParB family chromosome partitioning protein [Sphingobacterium sp. JUb56]MCS3553346.1 ParB family chromosome partitioning protein [Sphingobacterium sp. JUb21]MCW2262360.1 ParB family chromosome partitioning protein [Sphingobacterium kitahiroshimense]NJI74741.1 ParB/RepB/Spo0J family partition protein [Sphingobacterium sp. B1